MKIGLMSDTHNNVDITKKALSIFKDKGIDLILHAGDLTSPKMLDLFKGLKCKFVLGNGDIDSEELNNISENLWCTCIEDHCTFEIDNKKFILFHGNNVLLFRKAVECGEYDYIIKGHTHIFENYISNKSRVINPGALYGEELSIAILDTETDKVEMIRIEED